MGWEVMGRAVPYVLVSVLTVDATDTTPELHPRLPA